MFKVPSTGPPAKRLNRGVTITASPGHLPIEAALRKPHASVVEVAAQNVDERPLVVSQFVPRQGTLMHHVGAALSVLTAISSCAYLKRVNIAPSSIEELLASPARVAG